MARQLDEIRQDAINVLRVDFPAVEKTILKLEVFMRSRSKRAVYELRDFTNHMARIFGDETTPIQAEQELGEMRAHLRRCAIEPLEFQAEKTFVKLNKCAKWFGWLHWFEKDTPLAEPAFSETMYKIKCAIIEGRSHKGEVGSVGEEALACKCMNEAFDLGAALWRRMNPAKNVCQFVIICVMAALLGFLGAVGAGCAR